MRTLQRRRRQCCNCTYTYWGHFIRSILLYSEFESPCILLRRDTFYYCVSSTTSNSTFRCFVKPAEQDQPSQKPCPQLQSERPSVARRQKNRVISMMNQMKEEADGADINRWLHCKPFGYCLCSRNFKDQSDRLREVDYQSRDLGGWQRSLESIKSSGFSQQILEHWRLLTATGPPPTYHLQFWVGIILSKFSDEATIQLSPTRILQALAQRNRSSWIVFEILHPDGVEAMTTL